MTLSSGSSSVVLAAALLLSFPQSCGPDQAEQDVRDRERLREIFAIPESAELVSYRGFPPTMGFGQREGLSISACYLLTDEQEDAILEKAPSMGWRRLPITSGVLRAIPFEDLDVPLDIQEGVYTCRTAGDDVLRAVETRPVEEAVSVRDIILGVLDTRANRLYVQVRAGY